MDSPLTTFKRFPLPSKLKTTIGRALSMHKDIEVESITFKFLFRTSIYESLSNLRASLLIKGSSVYTPSIFVAFNITSA